VTGCQGDRQGHSPGCQEGSEKPPERLTGRGQRLFRVDSRTSGKEVEGHLWTAGRQDSLQGCREVSGKKSLQGCRGGRQGTAGGLDTDLHALHCQEEEMGRTSGNCRRLQGRTLGSPRTS
jgi:hypothetical protein